VISLLHLLSELVRYDITAVSGKVYPVHNNMPALITKFCEGSRVGSLGGGLRLLLRANRHATYQFEPYIGKAVVKIGIFENEIYLNISKMVCKSYHPGSKDDEKKRYICTTVFNANDLLASECNCKIGALEHKDRHICVHNPSLLRGLNLELYKGLAKQILIDFGVRVRSGGDHGSVYNSIKTKDAVALLATAAGKKLSTELSVNDMLDLFSVGTDRNKQYPGDPSPEFLRPIREVVYVSPNKKTEDMTSLKWRNQSEVFASEGNATCSDVASHSKLHFEDELIKMSLTCDAMRRLISRKYQSLKSKNKRRKSLYC
jgi:hypothetical protein